MTTEQDADGNDERATSPAEAPNLPSTPTRASADAADTASHNVDEQDEEEEEEDAEPKLKYNRLTGSLGPVYRNGDATSSSLVAADKMVLLLPFP